MSVYIPGMKIPGSCSDCLNIGWNYVFECRLDDAEEGKRLASCPLVPVPEFSDIGVDSDDVWKKIFTLIVLLLSDREKFDKLKDDMLADMEE